MKKYFYSNGQEKVGPFTLEELKLKEVQPTTLIWYEGLDDWTPAERLVELESIFKLIQPSMLVEKCTEVTDIKSSIVEARKVNRVQLSKSKGVRGWLLLLCIGLTIGMPLRTLNDLITSYYEASKYFQKLPSLQTLLYIDGFLSIFLMILSVNAFLHYGILNQGQSK